MKTKLLKKCRKEAERRIGVFYHETYETYNVVFDKRVIGDVSDWTTATDDPRCYQLLESAISEKKSAIEACDRYRRIFIIEFARRKWGKSKYGNGERIY